MTKEPIGATGWRLCMYAEHADAMWPPYAESERGDEMNVFGDHLGLDMNNPREAMEIPLAVIAALTAAVDAWKLARGAAS